MTAKEIHRQNNRLTENDFIKDIRETLRLNDRALIKKSEAARYLGLKPEDTELALIDVPKVNVGKKGRYHIKAIARYLARKEYFEFK